MITPNPFCFFSHLHTAPFLEDGQAKLHIYRHIIPTNTHRHPSLSERHHFDTVTTYAGVIQLMFVSAAGPAWIKLCPKLNISGRGLYLFIAIHFINSFNTKKLCQESMVIKRSLNPDKQSIKKMYFIPKTLDLKVTELQKRSKLRINQIRSIKPCSS